LINVCVVGLGKIGLPLAVQCASRLDVHVTGCDVDAGVVEAVNAGNAPSASEDGLATALERAVRSGQLTATTDTASAVSAASIVLIIVPVGLTDSFEIDYSHIDAATLAVGRGLQPGTLVIFETTVPVGTTRGRLASLLESASGLISGTQFMLAFSPERVYSGRVFRDLAAYPKVVGGINEISTDQAVTFYRSILDAPIRRLSSAEAAEYVKLVETTYRDVNIALANEFALFAEGHGLDVQEVIDSANTQPFSHVHRPSVGVGGHCIPVYPYFLFNSWDDFRLPPLARAINDGMAAHGVDLLEDALGSLEGARVLILGLTYRENVKETAFSSARKLRRELKRRDAVVLGHDPLLSDEEQGALRVQPTSLTPPPQVDGIIIQAYHDAYRNLDFAAFPGLRAVLDGRGALSSADTDALNRRGIVYVRIGRGRAEALEREQALA
jgi:nucleotide sugar dehydrogenase